MDAQERSHMLPDIRFDDLWHALGARGPSREVFLRLQAAYDEPQRAYHTASHIGACLRLLDEPAVRALAKELPEIEAAIWFHDAVYDPRASDNEEQSARMAEEHLGEAGVAPEVVRRIAEHVRATKHHSADSSDGELVLDIDLSILGETPEVFARFEEEIRREYAWVDEAAYAAGRSAVLRRFAERDFIYRTSLFRERCEATARANIAGAIAKLAR